MKKLLLGLMLLFTFNSAFGRPHCTSSADCHGTLNYCEGDGYCWF